jgi:hypothetical protein
MGAFFPDPLIASGQALARPRVYGLASASAAARSPDLTAPSM